MVELGATFRDRVPPSVTPDDANAIDMHRLYLAPSLCNDIAGNRFPCFVQKPLSSLIPHHPVVHTVIPHVES